MKLEENEIICPVCNGDGWTEEHDPSKFDYETGEHFCRYCPIQVGCDNCQGTGKIQRRTLSAETQESQMKEKV